MISAAVRHSGKCFSQVFARRRTTARSGLYARLCHVFLVLTVKATLNMSMMMMAMIVIGLHHVICAWLASDVRICGCSRVFRKSGD